MNEPRCQDCGRCHASGREGLACEWRLGGEDRVRRTLIRLGVAPTVIEQTVARLPVAGGPHHNPKD
jgi:hypothetical protein